MIIISNSIDYSKIPKWFNRGDADVEDFIVTDFTFDGTWRDLDLSGIIPAGTTLVLVALKVTHTATNVEMRFRTNGHTNSPLEIGYTTKGAMNMDYSMLTLQPDADGMLQYRGAATATWLVFTLRVMGWFK